MNEMDIGRTWKLFGSLSRNASSEKVFGKYTKGITGIYMEYKDVIDELKKLLLLKYIEICGRMSRYSIRKFLSSSSLEHYLEAMEKDDLLCLEKREYSLKEKGVRVLKRWENVLDAITDEDIDNYKKLMEFIASNLEDFKLLPE